MEIYLTSRPRVEAARGRQEDDRSTTQLALDLLRLAAQVLEAAGRLEHLSAGWVERHVRLPPGPAAGEEQMELRREGLPADSAGNAGPGADAWRADHARSHCHERGGALPA